MKTNKFTASKSTELTDATKSKVSTSNPQIIMQPDNSTNSINSTSIVNSDNTVNSTTPANADNLFDNEQTATEATATTAYRQATAQIGLRRLQGYIPCSCKAGKPSCLEHRGRPVGPA